MFDTETTLTLNDRVSKTLDKIIDTLGYAEMAFNQATKSVEKFALGLDALVLQTDRLSVALGYGKRELASFSSGVTSLNTKLSTTGTRAASSALGIEQMSVASSRAAQSFRDADLALANMNRQLTQTKALSHGMGTIRVAGGGGGSRGGSGGAAAALGMSGILKTIGGMPGKLAGTALDVAVTGMIGEQVLGDFITPGMEYEQTLKKLHRMGGISNREMAGVEGTARQVTKQVPTSTLTENVRNIQELYSIMGPGRLGEARELAPFAAKLDFAMQSYLKENPHATVSTSGLLQTVAKTAEQVGHFRNTKEAEAFMSNVFRQVVSTGGMSTPEAYAGTVKFMRGARFGKSDEFMFGALPFLIQEMGTGRGGGGGGSKGVGPMMTAFDTLTASGKVDKMTLSYFQKMGLIPQHLGKGDIIGTTTQGTVIRPGLMQGYNTAITDPFKWHQETFMHRFLEKAMPGVPFAQAQARFDSMPQGPRAQMLAPFVSGMNKTLKDFFTTFTMNEALIKKHIELYKNVGDLESQYNEGLNSTVGSLSKLNAQFQNLTTTISKSEAITKPFNTIVNALTAGMANLPATIGNLKKDFPLLSADFEHFGKMASEDFRALTKTGGDFFHTLYDAAKAAEPTIHQLADALFLLHDAGQQAFGWWNHTDPLPNVGDAIGRAAARGKGIVPPPPPMPVVDMLRRVPGRVPSAPGGKPPPYFIPPPPPMPLTQDQMRNIVGQDQQDTTPMPKSALDTRRAPHTVTVQNNNTFNINHPDAQVAAKKAADLLQQQNSKIQHDWLLFNATTPGSNAGGTSNPMLPR